MQHGAGHSPCGGGRDAGHCAHPWHCLLYTSYNKENDAQLQSQSYGSYPDLLDALQKGEVLFIALPGAKARALGVEGQPKHSSALGSLGYVAVCSSEESALSQLADVIIGELQQNGTLAQWVNRYQLG